MINNDLKNTPQKTNDRTTLKNGVNSSAMERYAGPAPPVATARSFSLVTNSVISHEGGKDRNVSKKNGTYPWSFVTHIFRNG